MIHTEEDFIKEVKKADFLKAIEADGWEECPIGVSLKGCKDFDNSYKLIKKVTNLNILLNHNSEKFSKILEKEEMSRFWNASEKLLENYNDSRKTGKRKKK